MGIEPSTFCMGSLRSTYFANASGGVVGGGLVRMDSSPDLLNTQNQTASLCQLCLCTDSYDIALPIH